MLKKQPNAPQQDANKHDTNLRSAIDTFPSRREVAKFLITEKRKELGDILEKGKTTKKLTNEQKGNLHEVLQHIATAQLDDEQTLTLLQEYLGSLATTSTPKQLLSLAQKLEALKQGTLATDTWVSRLQELLQDPEFITHYQESYKEHAEGIKHLSHGAELYRAPRIDLQTLTAWSITTKAPKTKQGTTLPLKHITDEERMASIEKLPAKQSLFSSADLAYLGLTKTTISLETLDTKIQQIKSYLDALQLHMYTSWQLTSDYPSAINTEIQTLRTLITKLEIAKQLHLDTHEVVAYERRHRLQWLKKELDTTWLASTETVTKQYEEMRQHIFAGWSVLLTGPVGTGKTVGARKLVAELIATKLARLQKQLKDLPPENISPPVKHPKGHKGEWEGVLKPWSAQTELLYSSSEKSSEGQDKGKVSSATSDREQKQLTPQQKLEKEIESLTKLQTDPPFINGNAETTVRQFESVVSQVKTWNGHLLEYLPGPLTQCMKYGLPLIIDEANRLSPDVLSALKGELAKRAGTSFTDKKTGESFIIQKFSIILTANEDHHHDTTKKFQDQIEREFHRVTIGYLPPAEYAQIISAKTGWSLGVFTDIWNDAWTANIDATDASKTIGGILPRLLEAQQLIIASYAKNGTKYDITLWWTTSKQQISSAIWDTKRFLELRNTGPDDRHDRIKYPTLTDYIKAKVIAFIKTQISDKDQMVLCVIFNKLGILDANDTPALADRNVCVHLKWIDFNPNLSLSLRDAPSSHARMLTTPYQRATADQYGDSYPDMPFDNPHIAYAQLASELMTRVQNNSTKTLLRQITKDGALRNEKLPKLVEALCTEGTDAYLGLYTYLSSTPDTLEKFGELQQLLKDKNFLHTKKAEMLTKIESVLPTLPLGEGRGEGNDSTPHSEQTLRDLLTTLETDNRQLPLDELTDALLAIDEDLFLSIVTIVGGADILDPSWRLLSRYDLIDHSRRKAAEEEAKEKAKWLDQQSNKQLSPWSILQLTSWPEFNRITKYRQDFLTQIKNTTETPQRLKQIGDAMIASGEFVLWQKAGLAVGYFNIPWFSAGFATSDRIRNENTPDPDDNLYARDYDNKILAPDTIYQPKLKALRSDLRKARKDPIKASIKPLESQGIIYDQQGDIKKLIALLMTQKWLDESDALALYMYLTGQYGYYWTWQYSWNSLGVVRLFDALRRFNSDDYDDSNCSLLFAVPSGSEVASPDAPEIQAHRAWWNDNITWIGTALLDPTKTKWILTSKPRKMDFPDEQSCKTELIDRMDKRAAKHIRHISNPYSLGGFATQITHPEFNSGNPRNFFEPQLADFNRITWNTATDNLSMQQYDYANQTKLWVKLRSIRGDMNTPDKLPDMIYEDETNKTGKQEKNLTKIYLQEVKKKIPTYNAQPQDELIKLMQVIGEDLWLSPESWKDQPLRKAALMYLFSVAGRYWTWQYSWNSRGVVWLIDVVRSFDAYDSDYFRCSLLFAGDA